MKRIIAITVWVAFCSMHHVCFGGVSFTKEAAYDIEVHLGGGVSGDTKSHEVVLDAKMVLSLAEEFGVWNGRMSKVRIERHSQQATGTSGSQELAAYFRGLALTFPVDTNGVVQSQAVALGNAQSLSDLIAICFQMNVPPVSVMPGERWLLPGPSSKRSEGDTGVPFSVCFYEANVSPSYFLHEAMVDSPDSGQRSLRKYVYVGANIKEAATLVAYLDKDTGVLEGAVLRLWTRSGIGAEGVADFRKEVRVKRLTSSEAQLQEIDAESPVNRKVP